MLDLQEIQRHIETRWLEICKLHSEYEQMIDSDYDYFIMDDNLVEFVNDNSLIQMSNDSTYVHYDYFEQENWKQLYIDNVLEPKRKEREANELKLSELREIRERGEYERLKNKFE